MTVRARLYDARGEDREIDLGTDGTPRIDDDRLLWVDIDGRDPAELQTAAAAIGLEPEALQRLSKEDRRARFTRLPERVVLTIGTVQPDDEHARRHELDIVIGQNHVITVHEGPLAAIEEYRAEIHNESQLGKLDAAGLTSGLIDTVFVAFFRQVEAIERNIDALDELAVEFRGKDQFLETVLGLRRRIARLRRALVPNREALAPMARPDFDLRSDLGRVSPDILARLERAIDSVENARELLVGSFDLYLGRESQRTNGVMKALTLISAAALPAIVLAGVMGMNFKLPFFDDPQNFWVVTGTMIAFSLVIFGIARWRSWI